MDQRETITVPLPKNIAVESNQLFNVRTPYSIKLPRIKQLKSAFITHEGLVLKNGLLVKGCAFNLRGKEDTTFYYQFWRDTIEKYAVCKWGKSLQSIHIKEPCLLIHSKWFNYSFWINSFLPRLIQAQEEGWFNKCRLIVPDGWHNIPYVWESLKAFDIEHIIIPKGVHVFADTLIMPETREWTAAFYPLQIQQTKKRLLKEAITRVEKTNNFGDKIYLTRSKRGVRSIENEEEVIEVLKKYNFSIITFEDLTIWEQIDLMSQTKVFISIHGAGFSNMMFMPKGANVLELINKPYAMAEYTFPFWKLANAAQLNYYAQFCDIKDASNIYLEYGKKNTLMETDYLVNKNIVVDITLFIKNIELMIE